MVQEQAVGDRGRDARMHLLREALTMALYVTICLIAGVIALPEPREHLLGWVWGIAIGLVLAHFFAFELSAELFSGESFSRAELRVGGAHLTGAAVVAALTSVPLLVVPASREALWVLVVLVSVLAITSYNTARRWGSRRLRAALYAATVALVALAIALVKNYLVGH